jgi:hypothetical protein
MFWRKNVLNFEVILVDFSIGIYLYHSYNFSQQRKANSKVLKLEENAFEDFLVGTSAS